MTIKGRLLLSVPIVKRFRPKNFLKSTFLPNFHLWGIKRGSVLILTFFNPKKALPWVKTRLLSHRASKSVEGYDL